MKTKLITALRIAAGALENKTFDYRWNRCHMCNCGSLFCALTGKSPEELSEMIPNIGLQFRTWETLVGQHCPIAGIPTNKLFAELLGYGLSQLDIINLENLSDPKILAAMPKRKFWQFGPNHKNSKDVIEYMRAWANLLVEEGRMDTAMPQKITRSRAEACI